MFSGIIYTQGKILDKQDWLFTVENTLNRDLKIWESIAHDGACMTITQSNKKQYSFFVMQESLDKTNLAQKKIWDTFNIEPSLKMSDSLDGHFVSGHIDSTGKIKDIIQNNDGSKYYFISFDSKYKNLIIEKGSITVNGVSLTVVQDADDYFSISVIPLTQEITNIWNLKIGDTVNLEFDIFAKYINKIQSNK